MTRSDLDQMRQLIRQHNRLPEPPKPRWSDLAARLDEEGETAPPPQPHAPVVAPTAMFEEPTPVLAEAAQAPTAEAQGRAAPASGSPVEPARGGVAQDPIPSPPPAGEGPINPADEAWRPDAVVHRLVELLMEMRALSGAVPPGAATQRAAA